MLIEFFINSILLGIGLTMDAFSVSIADGLNEPNMKKRKMVLISLTFAFFQFIMPLIGWTFVHFLADKFKLFSDMVPYIALFLLLFIGIKMIYDNFKNEEEKIDKELTFLILIIQGIATSIDALSVGFTISNYSFFYALIACLIICVITFLFCIVGLIFGKKISNKLSSFAKVLGGLILIFIGIEIFLSNIL